MSLGAFLLGGLYIIFRGKSVVVDKKMQTLPKRSSSLYLCLFLVTVTSLSTFIAKRDKFRHYFTQKAVGLSRRVRVKYWSFYKLVLGLLTQVRKIIAKQHRDCKLCLWQNPPSLFSVNAIPLSKIPVTCWNSKNLLVSMNLWFPFRKHYHLVHTRYYSGPLTYECPS